MDSKTYDELHGSNNWVGLIDPLDLNLRTLVIGYGDLSSAAERAFNNDKGSKYCGYSHFGKSSFFKGAMLPWAESKYEVTSFIYATAHINPWLAVLFHGLSGEGGEFESNWMGYIAVSNDEFSRSIGRREICVVWRGTARSYEWIDDIAGAEPVSAEPLFPTTLHPTTLLPIAKPNGATNKGLLTKTPQVMEGWLTIYNTSDPKSEFVKSSARTQISGQIKELLVKYKDEKVSITCTGHSLGACLAVLSAVDLASNIVPPEINVSAFIFECPQVGDQTFKTRMEELPNLKVLRVKNVPDIIPFWPSKILKHIDDENWVNVPSVMLGYVDVGVEILIDSNISPYLENKYGLIDGIFPLKKTIDGIFNPHSLQVVLHTLSGWNGMHGEFDWSLLKRSLGLVNMVNDVLKKEYKVPINWWGVKNKGMMLNDNCVWIFSPLDPNDHDLPAIMEFKP